LKNLIRTISIRIIYFIIRIFNNPFEEGNLNNVLVLAPHPDDEILGLGGFLLRVKNHGGRIHVVYLTDGENSNVWPDNEEIRNNRIKLSEEVLKNFEQTTLKITRLHLPDGEVPHSGHEGFEDCVRAVMHIIVTEKPEAVFATHTLDFWPYDHVACAEIAIEAIQRSNHKTQLWYYWVWAWYNVRPWNIFSKEFRHLRRIDNSGQLTEKNRLMAVYLDSYTPDGKPWSGVLPAPLLKAFEFPFEIVERII
jgi:LmbE family N-acetylglucosaminyl deacetylase